MLTFFVILKLFFRMASNPFPEKDSYSFGAHDWTWQDGEEAMINNRYTHDIERGMAMHYWRRDNESLRQGGITKAGSIHLAQSMLKNLDQKYLDKIQEPVTIMSATLDIIGTPETHQAIASRMKNSQFLEVHGAKHGILNEADVYRDQALETLTKIAEYRSRPYRRATHKPHHIVHTS